MTSSTPKLSLAFFPHEFVFSTIWNFTLSLILSLASPLPGSNVGGRCASSAWTSERGTDLSEAKLPGKGHLINKRLGAFTLSLVRGWLRHHQMS
jgi:hypothetical protein